ncbi:MAG: hypothetical protein Q9M89_05380 [Persephonella sp.]|nr:hypothetical protein [Persephonella sp.]
MYDIRFFLEGFRQDLKREKENLEQFYREYVQLNREIGANTDRYEKILLEFSTEELKFTLGFLTNIYRNIDNRKHTVIDSIFDAVEHSGRFELTVFYGNRILEKYSSEEIEDFLIRIYTVRRVSQCPLCDRRQTGISEIYSDFYRRDRTVLRQISPSIQEKT